MIYNPNTLIDELYKGQTITPNTNQVNPFATTDFLTRQSGTNNANTTPNGLPTGQINTFNQTPVVPVTPPGTVASITPQQVNGGQTARTDTFNYNTGYSGARPTVAQNPITPVPGSANSAAAQAGMYSINPEDAANAETMRLMAERARQASEAVFTPEQEYQRQLNMRQSEIDRINSFFQDQINQSRIQNAPEYQARLDQQRIQQIQGGFGASGAAQAQTVGTQEMNKREQAKAEAVLNAQRNDQVNAVLGKITDSVNAAQKDFNEAKRQGGADFINAINNRKGIRTQVASEIVKNLLQLGHEPTKEELEKYAQEASKLGISLNDIQNLYNTEKTALTEAKAKKDLETQKTQAVIAKDKADAAKTNFDVANWGKMTDYQKSQISIDRYKAQNPTGTASEKKANAMGKIAAEIKPGTTLADGTPVLDASGQYFTASGLKYMINNAPQLGLTKEEVLEQFGQFVYLDEKGVIPATYGLTPADKKIITGVIK